MADSICGIDCTQCFLKDECSGCAVTGGRPFGEPCVLAECCRNNTLCAFRQKLIDEFNSLGIEGMGTVFSLNPLKGEIVNMEFILPGGQKVKFWNDNRIYFGNLLPKQNSDRCFGLAADEKYLMVCECGADGSDPELILFKAL